MPALVHSARQSLYQQYRDRIQVNSDLSRALVSYQQNRKRPFFRWFKYKEGFSAPLVEYIVSELGIRGGRLLDPFAGTGASLMIGRELGFEGNGIELLPIGIKAIEARLAADNVQPNAFAAAVEAVRQGKWKVLSKKAIAFTHLNITQGAFPVQTERQLNRFRTYLVDAKLGREVRALLELACLSVLETVSYTRKDGQYLRWDHRAPRDRRGTKFDKGSIPAFDKALTRQLEMMLEDLSAAEGGPKKRGSRQKIRIQAGSCLELLPTLPEKHVDLIITSPPYCNRYDYTRTYALELAYLGVHEDQLKHLRQSMLSCTVENRPKREQLQTLYGQFGDRRRLGRALRAFNNQEALQEVLDRLDQLGEQERLNNSHVPRMVRNYFLEAAVVIFEMARIVKRGGHVAMVNDNVQYGGEEVPVDLILCELAEAAGFRTRRIWVLPRGKGNSSQQMGQHGRNELRKCVYLWQR
ncbi:MAG: hypothetical protein WBF93_00080 [Pirellulales bacterium]